VKKLRGERRDGGKMLSRDGIVTRIVLWLLGVLGKVEDRNQQMMQAWCGERSTACCTNELFSIEVCLGCTFSRSLRPWGSDYLYNLEEPLKLDQHGSDFGMAAA
jgi:hypothetical protein